MLYVVGGVAGREHPVEDGAVVRGDEQRLAPAVRRPHPRGSLVFDPGGPGGSGVATLKSDGVASFGKAARARFDIVGFDPRGVAGSKPALDRTARDDAADHAAAPGQSGQSGSDDDAPQPLYPRTDAERRAALGDDPYGRGRRE
ncbi:hypothetical protein [Streptomyces noursei]|uniref:hypothetical protein n=1 Tax=Streptomyces noursei TaxID=1971 RepID=UPI0030F25E21